MKTSKKIILAVLNFYVAVSAAIVTIFGVFYGAGEGQLGENIINLGYFKPFTIDSNILAGIASLIFGIFLVISLFKKNLIIPKWVCLLHFAAAVSLGLTFLTSAVFLAPIRVLNGQSYFSFFSDDMFFFHLLNPFVTILVFIFSEFKFDFGIKEKLSGIIPMFIYSIVYLINVLTGTWSDYYGFTFGGKYWTIPFVLIILYLVSFGIGCLLVLLKNKISRK